jgi:hypothetical protein
MISETLSERAAEKKHEKQIFRLVPFELKLIGERKRFMNYLRLKKGEMDIDMVKGDESSFSPARSRKELKFKA